MSKVLVIPDVHLKPWMFDQATEIMINTDCERAVSLGDLVDDWACQKEVELYEETLNKAIAFAKRFPDTIWCYGNHDLSYLWEQYDHPGYSYASADLVIQLFTKLQDSLEDPDQIGIIHRLDNVLFSHAGLSMEFIDGQLPDMKDDIDCMIEEINSYGVGELWEVNSPIWVRPQNGNLAKGMYDEGLFQVVGHTPVEKAFLLDNVLTLDTFSTTSSGIEIGDNEFYWVDTVTQEWGMVS